MTSLQTGCDNLPGWHILRCQRSIQPMTENARPLPEQGSGHALTRSSACVPASCFRWMETPSSISACTWYARASSSSCWRLYFMTSTVIALRLKAAPARQTASPEGKRQTLACFNQHIDGATTTRTVSLVLLRSVQQNRRSDSVSCGFRSDGKTRIRIFRQRGTIGDRLRLPAPACSSMLGEPVRNERALARLMPPSGYG